MLKVAWEPDQCDAAIFERLAVGFVLQLSQLHIGRTQLCRGQALREVVAGWTNYSVLKQVESSALGTALRLSTSSHCIRLCTSGERLPPQKSTTAVLPS